MEEIILYLKSKKRLLVIVFLTLLFAALILYPLYFLKKPAAQSINSKISVEVSGAVNKPGLFSLNPDGRVSDAIKLAGGFAANADQEFINSMLNQARQLEDGEKIFIPQKAVAATTQKATTATTTSSTTSGQVAAGQIVNINQANLDELDTLPGIGPAYAQRIIDYRTQNNSFKSIDEIKNIKGIGDKTFEKLKDLITI